MYVLVSFMFTQYIIYIIQHTKTLLRSHSLALTSTKLNKYEKKNSIYLFNFRPELMISAYFALKLCILCVAFWHYISTDDDDIIYLIVLSLCSPISLSLCVYLCKSLNICRTNKSGKYNCGLFIRIRIRIVFRCCCCCYF